MTNMTSAAASYISLEYFIHRKPWRKHKGGGDKKQENIVTVAIFVNDNIS